MHLNNYVVNNDIVRKDYAKAMEWFQKAAAQGNSDAQAAIGSMHLNGYSVRQDYAEAMEWFQKAAAQGNSDAQTAIGTMYFDANGVQKDYVKAMEWFQKAARQGNANSQYKLGNMYASGYVTKNLEISKEWYGKACDNGSKQGCSMYVYAIVNSNK